MGGERQDAMSHRHKDNVLDSACTILDRDLGAPCTGQPVEEPGNPGSRRSELEGRSMNLRRLLVCSAALLCVSLVITSSAVGQDTLVEDDFNRPDGPVGNGWSTWGDGQLGGSSTTLSGGTLRTFGWPNQAGGVYRSLLVRFPVRFSFEFSTTAGHDGGWLIAFNSEVALPPYQFPQVSFLQYRGSGEVTRTHRDVNAANVFVNAQASTPRANFDLVPTRVTGVVNADLSATFDVGGTIYTFPPAVQPWAGNTGSTLVLGNANATRGPHFIDNFVLSSAISETPGVSGVQPDAGGNGGIVTARIAGAKFTDGVSVSLIGNGTEIVASSVQIVDPSVLAASFDLRGAAPGVRDVAVSFPGGLVATLGSAFTIEQGGSPQIWVDTVGRGLIRPGFEQTYYVLLGNRGTVDSGPASVWVSFPQQFSWRSVDGWVVTDSASSSSGNRLVSLDVPSVPAGWAVAVPLTLSPPPGFGGSFRLRTWTNAK
jgi:hypothetical protein